MRHRELRWAVLSPQEPQDRHLRRPRHRPGQRLGVVNPPHDPPNQRHRHRDQGGLTPLDPRTVELDRQGGAQQAAQFQAHASPRGELELVNRTPWQPAILAQADAALPLEARVAAGGARGLGGVQGRLVRAHRAPAASAIRVPLVGCPADFAGPLHEGGGPSPQPDHLYVIPEGARSNVVGGRVEISGVAAGRRLKALGWAQIHR